MVVCLYLETKMRKMNLFLFLMFLAVCRLLLITLISQRLDPQQLFLYVNFCNNGSEDALERGKYNHGTREAKDIVLVSVITCVKE